MRKGYTASVRAWGLTMERGIQKVVGTRCRIPLPSHGGQNNMPAGYYLQSREGRRSNLARCGDVFLLPLRLHYKAAHAGGIVRHLAHTICRPECTYDRLAWFMGDTPALFEEMI